MLTYATLGVAYYSKKLNMPPDPILIMKAPIVYLHIRFNLLFSLSLSCACVFQRSHVLLMRLGFLMLLVGVRGPFDTVDDIKPALPK